MRAIERQLGTPGVSGTPADAASGPAAGPVAAVPAIESATMPVRDAVRAATAQADLNAAVALGERQEALATEVAASIEPGPFRAMTRGTVTRSWARLHHPGWFRRVSGEPRDKRK